MPKVRTRHRCSACNAPAPRWTGRCGECGAWNSIVEEVVTVASTSRAGAAPASMAPITSIGATAATAIPTGVAELDRVLGGGLVVGSATLLGGEPGIGKSTLLLQTLAAITGEGRRVLLVSAEESAQQVRLRAERLGAANEHLWLAAELELPRVLAAIGELEPDVVVVDSIQTVHDPELSSAAGSVSQVQACALALVEEAKRRGTAVVLVGHVTKDGALAGPRALEHLVDTVLAFEGDRHHALRLLRALKHRFGPTGELGIFEMTEQGLVGVPDAAGLFLTDRRDDAVGSVVFGALEGRRSLLVELQALVVGDNQLHPRRSAQGIDAGRLALLLAVLERHVGISTSKREVYASAVGGVRVVEPAADLAIALAVASTVANRAAPPHTVVIGEVGLGGEVRQVAHLPRRLQEAARLGFRRAIVPASCPEDDVGLELTRVKSVREAVLAVGLGLRAPAP